jgi:hypothetical protein
MTNYNGYSSKTEYFVRLELDNNSYIYTTKYISKLKIILHTGKLLEIYPTLLVSVSMVIKYVVSI